MKTLDEHLKSCGIIVTICSSFTNSLIFITSYYTLITPTDLTLTLGLISL